MTKRHSSSSSYRETGSSGSGGSGTAARTGAVRQVRLSQKSGAQNAIGGYMKVNHGNGTFSMKKIGN